MLEEALHFAGKTSQKLAVVVLASLFSLGLYQLWDLKTRWFVVSVAAIAMVAVAMCMVSVFSDFLMIVFFFVLPLVSFGKWFWPNVDTLTDRGNLVYGGILGLSLIDFLVVGFYLSWFYRIFVARTQPFQRLHPLDLLIIAFVFVQLLATIGAVQPIFGLESTEYLLKHVLLYFYISRNLRPSHLPWMVVAVCSAIFIEASLSVYQHHTGKLLGFALDKGAGSTTLNYQYSVPGLTQTRATGTSYDSHALGDFVGMLLPLPLVLALTPWVKPLLRIMLGVIAALGLFAVVLSFSRSAWLGSAIALSIGVALFLIVWQEGTIIPVLAICGLLFLVSSPWTAKVIGDQFKHARYSTLETRFEQYEVALTIWTTHPILGVGPGNYIYSLRRYDYFWLQELPVHDVMLWIAAETGIVGLLIYLGIVFGAMKRLFRVAWRRKDLTGRIAMGALIGLLAYFFDGLTDPLFREPNVFATLWLLIALAVSLSDFAPESQSTVEGSTAQRAVN
jgi:O-antigen ligase